MNNPTNHPDPALYLRVRTRAKQLILAGLNLQARGDTSGRGHAAALIRQGREYLAQHAHLKPKDDQHA